MYMYIHMFFCTRNVGTHLYTQQTINGGRRKRDGGVRKRKKACIID